MINFFLFISFCASSVFANGSGGFRGGGDSIAAEFTIVAREWAASQPSKQTQLKIENILSKLRVVSYFNDDEIQQMDYEQIQFFTYPVFIDASEWQGLDYLQKVGYAVDIANDYYQFQYGKKLDIEHEKELVAIHACRKPQSDLCKKIYGVEDFKFPQFRFNHLGKSYFRSLERVLTHPGEVTMASVVREVYQHLDEVTVLDSKGPLMINGAFVVAINDRSTKTIYVDKSKWNFLNDEQKMNLVIHEYISVLGYEDSDYGLSNVLAKKLK